MDKRIENIINNPARLFLTFGRRGLFNWVSDEQYLKIAYRIEVGEKLNLDNPKSFNEKVQWMKLYDRRPEYTMMVDKYKVKQYVKSIIGEEYIIPTIAVWSRAEEISVDSLPDQFVLKCNHDSGSITICKNKMNINVKDLISKYRKLLKRNGYWYGREWSYKDVVPCIIAEPYMVDESGVELKDYKVFCFNGEPKFIQVDFDRFIRHKRNLYTPSWELIESEIKYRSDKNHKIDKPYKLDEMITIAKMLSKDIPHVRVDFYSIGKRLYFGELTFYHGSGFEEFRPRQFGEILGDWIFIKNKSEK